MHRDSSAYIIVGAGNIVYTGRMGIKIGIDDMALVVPELYLDMKKEFAKARNVSEQKITTIGIEKMAVPDVHEDAVTLGADAMQQLMSKNDLRPKDMATVYVATESSVDESKAMGTYIMGVLEKIYGDRSFRRVDSRELKCACASGMQAVYDAKRLIESGHNSGKCVVVIATDIARYDMGSPGKPSPGELTQGAGAVAMLIKPNPRLLELDDIYVTSFRHKYDFYRPPERDTAIVDSKNSKECYLEAMLEGLEDYTVLALKSGMITLKPGECLSDYFAMINFHIPFPRMAENAAAEFFRRQWRGLLRMKSIEAAIGSEPKREDFKAHEKHLEDFRDTPTCKSAYKEKVEPTTLLSRQIGNIYTGSIFLGIISGYVSTLNSRNLAGVRVGLGAYGSGRMAIVGSGVTSENYREVVSKMDPRKALDSRQEISLIEYEALHPRTQIPSIRPPRIGGCFREYNQRNDRMEYDFARKIA